MAGSHGEMDFLHMPWSDDVGNYVHSIMESMDTILLGRKLAEGFIPAWESGPPGEDQESIDWMNNTPRVVFSNTLSESPWKNATITSGNLAEAIGQLKSQDGGDIIAYGGGTLVAGLIAAGLADEIHLLVNPTAIGSGMPIFPNTGSNQSLRMAEVVPFECGMAAVRWQPLAS